MPGKPGTGGRPPKPLEVHRRNGNPSRKQLPKTTATLALEPAHEVPPVPISLDESGRNLWEQIWAGPAKMWLSPAVDVIRVTTVCQLQQDIAGYQQVIERSGPLLKEPIVTPTGVVVGDKIVANPLVRMRNDALKILNSELAALGFDPTSRARLGYTEVKTRSILDDLYDGAAKATQAITAAIIDIASDEIATAD